LGEFPSRERCPVPALLGGAGNGGRHAPPPPPLARAVAVRGEPRDPTAPRPGNGHDPGTASVVVPTHNDGANIGPLLERLVAEPCVAELIVVASGCDDDTVPVACRVADTQPPAAGGRGRVHVYVEAVRSGKAAAVNFGVSRCTQQAIVVVSGDVLPAPGAVGLVVAALAEPGVGMAGGRPSPVNGQASIADTAVHLLWRVHHRLALRQPKLGEMVALRAEAAVLLPVTSVDEAYFQALLEAAGWRSRYVPGALVANRGPGTVADFVKQRRQIHTGHLWLRRREAYTVPSRRAGLVARAYLAELRSGHSLRRPLQLARTTGAVSMELLARALARLDFLRGKETHVWDMVRSAKDPALGPDGVGARGR
jgi:glycosyltransferase involved in cell wall biosynthesis